MVNLIDHLHRFVKSHREGSKHNVVNCFSEDSPYAKSNHVSKLRVVNHANDQLSITLDHFGNQEGHFTVGAGD